MARTARHIVRDLRTRNAREVASGAGGGTDLRLMRESNRLLVLNCVREHGVIPRASVARYTGLSRTTVGSIIDALITEGFVREGDAQRSEPSRNRRVIPVHFNANAGYILGIAMGRHHLTILLCDLAATIVRQKNVTFIVSNGPEVCLPQLVTELHTFLEEQRIPWGKIVGIGLGMPGPIDAMLQGPTAPPRMPGWDGTPVARYLEAELQVPVYLDKNANMGALGEIRYGAGRSVSDLMYLKVGANIGSGLIVGGRVYRGSGGSAGEVGHMTVDPNGALCDCGNRGCLEVLAGARAIVEDARQRGADVADMDQVIAAAQGGDIKCMAALGRAAEWIGIALTGLVNFINPSLIVLDGSTMRAGDLMVVPIRRYVAEHCLPAPRTHMEITMAALAGNAIALGGVATVIDVAFGVSSWPRSIEAEAV